MKSVQSTMQITKAMELVATSKLRRAKERVEKSRFFHEVLADAIKTIRSTREAGESVWGKPREQRKSLYIVMAGDRGLAGGYNANLFKFTEKELEGHDYAILPIGKKAVEYFTHKKAEIFTDAYSEVATVTISECFRIAKSVCEAYEAGKFGHVSMCYTNFVSMMSQVPKSSALLPLSDFENPDLDEKPASKDLILYEPSGEEVFNTIVPEYLAGILYTSINVSVASELAARRTAMEAATDNASEMIEKLSLFYNRARQASITQEITEIVAGAEGA
jgi:F-type H+-transporting ATPase subunit gamma